MDFKDLTLKELVDVVSQKGRAAYTAKNIFNWVYKKGTEDFSKMSNVSKELREFLSSKYSFFTPKILSTEKSSDGCVKFLFELHDGETIESVLIPKEDRVTVCVSTQVGCKMGCVFCCTAEQGFTRNLSASEIVNQVISVNNYARDVLNYAVDDSGIRAVTNIVYMGMGEPLDNLDEVIKSVDIISNHNGLAFGFRKITVSTCGIVPKMIEFKEKCQARLALSLNACSDQLRNKLMPINKTYDVTSLMSTIKTLPMKLHDFVTIEYIMFKGVNDSIDDAKHLARLLNKLPVKVNLIPFNKHLKAKGFDSPGDRSMHDFYDYLAGKDVICNVRYSRGADINAACGQLKSRAGK